MERAEVAASKAPVIFAAAERAYLARGRVAHLATAGADGLPHVVPVCYAFDGEVFFSAIDEKPKRVSPRRLRRIRNILERPQVSLVVDTYSDDWDRLGYVLVYGTAEVITEGPEYLRGLVLLRAKYPQYGKMALEERPMIRIVPTRATRWGAIASGVEG